MISKINTSIRQIALTALMITLSSIIIWSLAQLTTSIRIQAGYVLDSITLGSIWAYVVFQIFSRYFANPKVLAALVSFNVVFLLEAMNIQHGGSLLLASITALSQFAIFLIPSAIIIENFAGIFEIG